MPILISQIIARPALSAAFVINMAVLGTCIYLLVTPNGPRGLHALLPDPQARYSEAAPESAAARFAASARSGLPAADSAAPDPISNHRPLSAGSVQTVTGLVFSSPRADDSRTEALQANAVSGESQGEDSGGGTPGPAVSLDGVSIAGASPRSNVPPAGASSAGLPSVPVPPGARIPLAFTALNNGAAATPSQAAALSRLQDDFINSLAGTNQNPADPAYAQSFQSAQEASDEHLRLWLGWQGYVQEQLAQLHGH